MQMSLGYIPTENNDFIFNTINIQSIIEDFHKKQSVLKNYKSPLRLHAQLVTPNHWFVTQRMNMR